MIDGVGATFATVRLLVAMLLTAPLESLTWTLTIGCAGPLRKVTVKLPWPVVELSVSLAAFTVANGPASTSWKLKVS